MDNQSISHQKPLLESGTLGLKGNVQVILPNLTESYGSTTDKAEDQIPVCTLKNFPYEISHCIQWAREQFESLFVLPFQTYNKLYIEHKNEKLKEKLDKILINELYDIKQNIDILKLNLYEIFTKFYNDNYRQKIYDLINQYPEDHILESGEKFWSGVKKYPRMIDFDIDDIMCKNLYESFKQIMNNINITNNFDDILNLNEHINTELNTTNKKTATNAEEDKKLLQDELNSLDYNQIKEDIINFISSNEYNFNIIEFEKDDDTNGHIKFITACSNLRALNYSIKPSSEFETKGIAGKIIPALATTTSIVSGLVAIELYKLINNKSYKIENFKNTFLGLGVCFMGSSEPMPCITKKIGELNINLWTKLKYNNMTVDELIKKLNKEYKIKVDQIMYNDKSIYTCFMNTIKRNEILNKKIFDITNNMNCVLNVSVSDREENDDIILIEVV